MPAPRKRLLFGIGLGRTRHLAGIPRGPDFIEPGTAAFWQAIERVHTLGLTLMDAGWTWDGQNWRLER